MTLIRTVNFARWIIALSILMGIAAFLLAQTPTTQAMAEDSPCGTPGGFVGQDLYKAAQKAANSGNWKEAETNLQKFLLNNGLYLLQCKTESIQPLWNDLHCYMHRQPPQSGKPCTYYYALQKPQSAGVSDGRPDESAGSETEIKVSVTGEPAPGCHGCQWDLYVKWREQGLSTMPPTNEVLARFLPATETILPTLQIYEIAVDLPFYYAPVESATNNFWLVTTPAGGGGTLTPLTFDVAAGWSIICRGGNFGLSYLFDQAAFEFSFPDATGFKPAPEPIAAAIDIDGLEPGECIAIGAPDEIPARRSFIASHLLFQGADEDGGLEMERSSSNEWQATAPAMLEQFLDDDDMFIEFQMVIGPAGNLEASAAEVISDIE